MSQQTLSSKKFLHTYLLSSVHKRLLNDVLSHDDGVFDLLLYRLRLKNIVNKIHTNQHFSQTYGLLPNQKSIF